MRYDLFNHNRRSTRLRGYDYSRAGTYFVTICVLDRECLLGNCVGEEIILSQIGETAKRCWINIPAHFEYIILDEFVIMPNHIHGIVTIQNGAKRRGVPWNAPTRTSISPPQGSLSVVVRNYKAAAARLIRLTGHSEFRWQRNFHDHIIRNQDDLNRIRKYIRENCLKWQDDDENPHQKP